MKGQDYHSKCASSSNITINVPEIDLTSTAVTVEILEKTENVSYELITVVYGTFISMDISGIQLNQPSETVRC